MSPTAVVLLVIAVCLVLLAGVFAALDAALQRLSKARVEELRRVKETVINALGLSQSLIVDPEAVPLGTENTVYARIGMILDLSHVAPSVMHQSLDQSRLPVLFTHSWSFTSSRWSFGMTFS